MKEGEPIMKERLLTVEQRELVESNLSVVQWVIRESIQVNNSIYGFEYDDLYQEGCLWLCHAAMSYNAARSQFSTYAKTVVRNGLLSYCRQICSRQKHISRLSVGEHGELVADNPVLGQRDEFTVHISDMETLDLLQSRITDYRGVSRLGIEALELKVKGMSISEIARLYDVPPSHVGAWISRSAKKLRKDHKFLSGIL